MEKEREYLYKLMYSAFVQMREEAYERKDKKVYRICDLLHNVPLKLLKTDNKEGYKEMYQELINYVKSYGMEPWLNYEIEQIKGDVSGSED
jgi:hypothetical protein